MIPNEPSEPSADWMVLYWDDNVSDGGSEAKPFAVGPCGTLEEAKLRAARLRRNQWPEVHIVLTIATTRIEEVSDDPV